jgi:hypothetical protein
MTRTAPARKRAARAALAVAPLLLSLAACGSSHHSASAASSAGFVGSIGGSVVVLATGEPVANALAEITINGTVLTARSDAEGRFAFNGVPYGAAGTTYAVTIDLRDDPSAVPPRVVSPSGLTSFAYTSARLDPSLAAASAPSGTSFVLGGLHAEAAEAAARRTGVTVSGSVLVAVAGARLPIANVTVSIVETPGVDQGGDVNGLEHSTVVAAVKTDDTGAFTLTGVPELDAYDLLLDGSAAGFVAARISIGAVGVAGTSFLVPDGALRLAPAGTDRTAPAVTSKDADGGGTLPVAVVAAAAGTGVLRFGFSEPIDPSTPPAILVGLDENGNGTLDAGEPVFASHTEPAPGSLTTWTLVLDEPVPGGAGLIAGLPPLVLDFTGFRDLSGNAFAGDGLTGALANPSVGDVPAGVAIQVFTEASAPQVVLTIGGSALMGGGLVPFSSLGGPVSLSFDRAMVGGVVSIALDTAQDGLLGPGDTPIFSVGSSPVENFTATPRIVNGVASATIFDVDLGATNEGALPAGLGATETTFTPPVFSPPQLVVKLTGFADANGNAFTGGGLGPQITLDAAGAVHLALRTAVDPTLLAVDAGTVAISPDPATVTFLPPIGPASAIPQANAPNSLDLETDQFGDPLTGELQLAGPYYSTSQFFGGIPIPFGTPFGDIDHALGLIDHLYITFQDPTGPQNPNAVATEFDLYVVQNAGPLLVASLANPAPGGGRTFAVNLGSVLFGNNPSVDNSPFAGGQQYTAFIRTTNQIGHTADSGTFVIRDTTPPTVARQLRVDSQLAGRSPSIGVFSRPVTPTLRFDLFPGDLDESAAAPNFFRPPTFLPIVEVRNEDLDPFAEPNLDAQSNDFGARRPNGRDQSYSYDDLQSALHNTALDGTTIFTGDVPVDFSEALAPSRPLYTRQNGDLAYFQNSFSPGSPGILSADAVSGKGDITQLSVRFADLVGTQTGDFLSFPGVADVAGNKAGTTPGAQSEAVVRSAVGPVIQSANMALLDGRRCELTLIFTKSYDPASASDPASYAIDRLGDGNFVPLDPAQVQVIANGGNAVFIDEISGPADGQSAGSAGFANATADWAIKAPGVMDVLRRATTPFPDLAIELGAPSFFARVGDLVPPVLLSVADVSPAGPSWAPGTIAGTTITLAIVVSEDCLIENAQFPAETIADLETRILLNINPSSDQGPFFDEKGSGVVTITSRSTLLTSDRPADGTMSFTLSFVLTTTLDGTEVLDFSQVTDAAQNFMAPPNVIGMGQGGGPILVAPPPAGPPPPPVAAPPGGKVAPPGPQPAK